MAAGAEGTGNGGGAGAGDAGQGQGQGQGSGAQGGAATGGEGGGGNAGTGAGAGQGAGQGSGAQGGGSAQGGGAQGGGGTQSGQGSGTGQGGAQAGGQIDAAALLKRSADAEREAATARAEAEKARGELQTRVLRDEVATVGKKLNVDPTLAVALLKSGEYGVTVEFDKDGKPKDLEQKLKDLAEKCPLVVGQADARSGGASRAGGQNLTVDEQIDALFNGTGRKVAGRL